MKQVIFILLVAVALTACGNGKKTDATEVSPETSGTTTEAASVASADPSMVTPRV